MSKLRPKKALSKMTADEEKARNIPILAAVNAGQIETVKKLIAEDTKVVNIAAPGGNKTPLHIAAENNNEPMIILLIDSKADPRTITTGGFTPLHAAAQIGNKNIIRRLAIAGSPVNAPSKMGCTALHEAASAGHEEAVRTLLEFKADPTIRDNRYHLTAANLAHHKGHHRVRDILVDMVSYQQSFMQNIRYILFNWKNGFLPNSKEYNFLDRLINTLSTIENSDEMFRIIRDALKSPEYKLFKEKFVPIRELLIANMNQYNKNRADAMDKSKALSVALATFGISADMKHESASSKSLTPFDLILEYCDSGLPQMKC